MKQDEAVPGDYVTAYIQLEAVRDNRLAQARPMSFGPVLAMMSMRHEPVIDAELEALAQMGRAEPTELIDCGSMPEAKSLMAYKDGWLNGGRTFKPVGFVGGDTNVVIAAMD